MVIWPQRKCKGELQEVKHNILIGDEGKDHELLSRNACPKQAGTQYVSKEVVWEEGIVQTS